MTRRYWIVASALLAAIAAVIFIAPHIIMAQQSQPTREAVTEIEADYHCNEPSSNARRYKKALTSAPWLECTGHYKAGIPQDNASQEPDIKGKNAFEVRWSWGVWLLYKTLTDPITILTGVLAIYTVRLVGQGRREFIATHRPKIVVRQVAITGVIPDSKATVGFDIVNVGEGLAREIKISAIVYLLQWNKRIPRNLSLGEAKAISKTLESGEKTGTIHSADVKFNAEEIRGMKYGNPVLYAIGVVEYLDENRTLRKTGFARICCFEESGGWVGFDKVSDDDYEYSD